MKTTVWAPKQTAAQRPARACGRPRKAGALRRRALMLACLVACLTLSALPAAASAAIEMRGEWTLMMESGGHTIRGLSIVSQEADAGGNFASNAVFEGVIPGTFSGTLGATEASVVLTSQAYGPYEAAEFKSTTMQIQTGGSHPALSGSGTLSSAKSSAPATLTATRIRTYKEIEEQHERELKEQEEREARENVRGEWALVLTSGPQTVHGVARITEVANEQDEFASKAALFESAVPGTFSGTLSLEAAKTAVKVTSEAAGPLPASTFTSSTMTLATVAQGSATTLEISGSGTLTMGATSVPATLEATRVKTYLELKELEAREKLERETKEREAREAKEREAREAQERLELQAKEKLEKELAAKAATQTTTTTTQTTGQGGSVSLVSVELGGGTLGVSNAGSLALLLSNPNGFAIAGRVTLVAAGHAGSASAHHRGRKRSGSLGTASFGISAKGKATVRLRLSQLGRAELARHKTLRVVAIVTTEASGHANVTKRYSLTLSSGVRHRR